MDSESVGALIVQIGFLSAIAYLPLQTYAGVWWRGVWRIVALVPLSLMVPLFALTAYLFVAESNLWPIFLIFLAPLGTFYLLVLLVIRCVLFVICCFATPRPNGARADRHFERSNQRIWQREKST